MKLLRVGELGSEIVAALDSNNVIRDLSDHIKDLNPQTINEETLNKLKKIKITELKESNSNIRIGACISNPVDFLAIGLNYKAHAEGTKSKLPTEPIVFNKSSGCIQGPNDQIVKPKSANKMDYEVEVGCKWQQKTNWKYRKNDFQFQFFNFSFKSIYDFISWDNYHYRDTCGYSNGDGKT